MGVRKPKSKSHIYFESKLKRKKETEKKQKMLWLYDVERTQNPNVLIHKFKFYDNYGEEHKWEELLFCDELSDNDLMKIYDKIKPLVVKDGLYYHVKDYSLYELKKNCFLHDGVNTCVNMNDAEVIDEFLTYHNYGKNGFFSPTVLEVLQQFPKYALCESNAFCIATFPKTLERAHCHVATVKALKIKK